MASPHRFDRSARTATAVVIEQPEKLSLQTIPLPTPADDEVVVDLEWTGISTGTERLLYSGRMPPFPGLGYPLVPGYESVGRVREAGPRAGRQVGQRVFVPGASCFGDVRGLFGGAASRVVVAGARALPLGEALDDDRAVLLALAATARHALAATHARAPDLIVGHGVLGRLLARLAVASGAAAPVVWERQSERRAGAAGYRVLDPAEDTRRDYRAIYDVSGDAGLVDELVARLAPGGELVLAGFYCEPIRFDFAPAFMREARLRIAAEWQPDDLMWALEEATSGRLSLDALITHRLDASEAATAYRTAFTDPACLKMVLDWRAFA